MFFEKFCLIAKGSKVVWHTAYLVRGENRRRIAVDHSQFLQGMRAKRLVVITLNCACQLSTGFRERFPDKANGVLNGVN